MGEPGIGKDQKPAPPQQIKEEEVAATVELAGPASHAAVEGTAVSAAAPSASASDAGDDDDDEVDGDVIKGPWTPEVSVCMDLAPVTVYSELHGSSAFPRNCHVRLRCSPRS